MSLIPCHHVNVAPAILGDDEEAVKTRQELGSPFVPISLEEAESGAQKRPIRVYSDGVFDLFHYGHANLLAQVKNRFPGPVWVIAGVNSEANAVANKRQPRMSEAQRLLALRHCRYVDEALVVDNWFPTLDFINAYKIDFVMHDNDPYVHGDLADMYGEVKRAGRFVESHRTPGISTTQILEHFETMHDDASTL